MKPVLVISGDTKYLEKATLNRVGNIFVIRCYFTDKTSHYYTPSVMGVMSTSYYVKEDDEWKQISKARNTFSYSDSYPGDGVVFNVYDNTQMRNVGTISVVLVHPPTMLLEVLGYNNGNYPATVTIATTSFIEQSWDDKSLLESYPKE